MMNRKNEAILFVIGSNGMRAIFLSAGFCLVIFALANFSRAVQRNDTSASEPSWIWSDEGKSVKQPPAETRYFRKTFAIRGAPVKPVEEAELDITAVDGFKVWINGKLAGTGANPQRVFRFHVQPLLVNRKNVIAVEATNRGGPAGLLVRLGYVPNGGSKLAVVSDGSWKVAKQPSHDWESAGFDDSRWATVKVLGPYGKVGRWNHLAWDAGSEGQFKVPPGFRVETAAINPDGKDPFSLINLCFDDRGRLLVSKENGPILLCTNPNTEGAFQTVKPYCEQVKNSQGMLWDGDSLLLVGDGPEGTGLYRVWDTQEADKVDKVKLLHKFPEVKVSGYGLNGKMAEHGPHAILRGPDGWLYLILGNHSWAGVKGLATESPLIRWPDGLMGPDQTEPGSTEDILLPRVNDARGHAANILAPGGTIWRLDRRAENWSLVAAGLRNAYDAAFSPRGELFTFDSDMEWDEELPWYRPVRVCHCPPGADFMWRSGAANTPDYYIDSLPPVLATGRGSPVGMEFYEHHAFPQKYRGALFAGDWSLGIIWAFRFQRQGASYRGTAERFCEGAPMNVTDVAIGPEGALYFTMGGRGSQGGVFRILYTKDAGQGDLELPQPLSAWGRTKERAKVDEWIRRDGETNVYKTLAAAVRGHLHDSVASEVVTPLGRVGVTHLLDLMQNEGLLPDMQLLKAVSSARDPEVCAHAIWLLGVNGWSEGRDTLIHALADQDPLVRRYACEALIRAGMEPPLPALWPLLSDSDKFVRTAARVVLQRMDPSKWANQILTEPGDRAALEGIVALCKSEAAESRADALFGRLDREIAASPAEPLLDYLRTLQLLLVHSTTRPSSARTIALRCDRLFPNADWRVNRELAILLAYFRHEGLLDASIQERLLNALLASSADRKQQIHYFYCLRLLHQGWNAQQKQALLEWYDSTKTWKGGHSYAPFLKNILRDLKPIFTDDDVRHLIAEGERLPWAATAILGLGDKPACSPGMLEGLFKRLAKADLAPGTKELKAGIIDSLGRERSNGASAALRSIEDADPEQCDAITRALSQIPVPENWNYLVRGLRSQQADVLVTAMNAMEKIEVQPKQEDPSPYRSLLLAARPLNQVQRWEVVKLLRHWTHGKRFGSDEGDAKTELSAWARWFAQTFPKEPPLPDVAGEHAIESQYKFSELLSFLEQTPGNRQADAERGRLVFEKAQCAKCHKYGREGQGIGPDLSTVSKRFKRSDILESIYYPSKVISDQYRSTLILTKSGRQINGLVAPQGDMLTILQSDGSTISLRKDEVDQQFASLVSVMPERLLDALTKKEIADLFSFLESAPK
jgi:putative heme-binding domain-containing protein